MRLRLGNYENFCCFGHLSFYYSERGLCSITGPTGAGKSTVMDAVAWCLYGMTSKDGAADEIRPWGVSEPTKGVQEVELPGGTITVIRIRGSARQNDLFWEEPNGETKRGKDINETQKMLEERLGCSAELYFTSAYLHQFSRADSFFIAKAKDRRDILERIADLSLPVLIADRAREQKKTASAAAQAATTVAIRHESRFEELGAQLSSIKEAHSRWLESHIERINDLRKRSEQFESEREDKLSAAEALLIQLDEEMTDGKETNTINSQMDRVKKDQSDSQRRLNEFQLERGALAQQYKMASAKVTKLEAQGATCNECGQKINEAKRNKALSEANEELSAVEAKVALTNKYIDGLRKHAIELEAQMKTLNETGNKLVKARHEIQTRFEAAKVDYERWQTNTNIHATALLIEESQEDPYAVQLVETQNRAKEADAQARVARAQQAQQDQRVSSLTQLYDLSMELRGKLLEKSVMEIEAETNRCLERYFDGELRVEFLLDADRLDVEIQKGGYACSFRQLSGGQRCMLKLAFSLSLMSAAANKAGIHFDTIFLDEPLNGLDADLKVKAFALFEELAERHESVLVIEHSEEFKNLFSSRYAVKLGAEGSLLEEVTS